MNGPDGPEEREADRLERDDEARRLAAERRADEDRDDATEAYNEYWLERVK